MNGQPAEHFKPEVKSHALPLIFKGFFWGLFYKKEHPNLSTHSILQDASKRSMISRAAASDGVP